MTTVVAPTSVTRGATASVVFGWRNQGNASATSSFVVRVYLHTRLDLTQSPILIHQFTKSTGPFVAGLNDTDEPTVTIPAGMAAGQYYLLVQIDATNLVTESNETNNIGSASTRVTVN